MAVSAIIKILKNNTMNFKKKIGLGLITVFTCVIAFYSCNKNDKKQDAQNDIERIREKVNQQPFSTTSVLNLPGKGYYGDADGNPLVKTSGNKSSNGISTMGAGCPDPGDYSPSETLVSISTEITCGQGYIITAVYDFTSVYSPVLTSATGAASYGRIRFKNAAGVVIWPTVAPTPKYNIVSIENRGDIGIDVNTGLMETTYRVTFKTGYLTERDMIGAASIEPSFICYTDCPNIPTFSVPFSSQQSSPVLSSFQAPCNRTDRVFFNGAGAGYDPNISGIANSLYCGSGYQFPTSQDVEFLNSQGVWVPFYLKGPGFPEGFKSTISSLDIAYINVTKSKDNLLVTGNVQVRYRNRMSSGCTSSWVYTTWYIQ
jgi:hypothetical protein